MNSLDRAIDTRLSSLLQRDKAKEHLILSTTEGLARMWAIFAYAAEQDLLEDRIEEERWRARILKDLAYDPFLPEEMVDDFPHEAIPDAPATKEETVKYF